MRLLLDMNLSPALADALADRGFEAVHWVHVGKATAPDVEILDFALKHHMTLITHDLDFGAILAATGGHAPSVVQVRTQDVLSEGFLSRLVLGLHQFAERLEEGCLLVIEADRLRARLLPLLPTP
jgi:predicted nuclease of predicted toxin-antitoxin system